MVVESSTPSYLTERSSAADPPADAGLGPKMVGGQSQREEHPSIEMPVPGGRHDLEADDPVDPAADLARLQAEMGTPPEEWVPFQSSWQPSEQTWKPLADSWQQSRGGQTAVPTNETPSRTVPVPRPVPPPDPSRPKLRDLPRATMPPVPVRSEPPVPQPPVPSTKPTTQPSPSPQAPDTSRFLLPLVWFNSAFDVMLLPLGPAGSWLQSKRGGGFLAFLGLVCMASAVALAVADGIGWTW